MALKSGKSDIKAASKPVEREVSDERALAKLSLNFGKSSRSPIFVRTFGGARLAHVWFFSFYCHQDLIDSCKKKTVFLSHTF